MGSLIAGCSFEIPVKTLWEFPPIQEVTRINGTYADHSPSEFGGSLWEFLTGEDLEDQEGQACVETSVQVAGNGKLTAIRLLNGVESRRRQVPFRFKGGYIRISHPRFMTVLLVSDMGRDEVAMTAESNGDLWAFQEKGHLLFLTVVPVPTDPGPIDWHMFRRLESR